MRTLVVGDSWITKYFIADTLYNDGNFEEYIQVISPTPSDKFFEGFAKLQEFQGDERLSYVERNLYQPQLYEELQLDYVDAIYIDAQTEPIDEFINFLKAKKFTKRVVL